MRAVLQRVSSAQVSVDGEVVGQIGRGLLVLLGAAQGDEDADLDYIFEKTIQLRIFSDEEGKMNLSLVDVGGALLVVSQFTLLAQTRRGRRPSLTQAMAPEPARAMYERFIERARQAGIPTEGGQFGATMQVSLVNEGPVTIILESHER
jgi:D-tyrosyl-tRNA(Tyr) deacylase